MYRFENGNQKTKILFLFISRTKRNTYIDHRVDFLAAAYRKCIPLFSFAVAVAAVDVFALLGFFANRLFVLH